eukprot:gene28719-35636_t
MLRSVDTFDAAAFDIPILEASLMDPQQRLLLHAVADVHPVRGKTGKHAWGDTTGVFVGISSTDYHSLFASHKIAFSPYMGTGSTPSVAAGRLSYVFGLKGPALSIDTACSSSLVATHQAYCSLVSPPVSGCRAVSCGVSLMLAPSTTIVFAISGMLSADGRSKTLDAAADGYARGEACGVVSIAAKSDVADQQDGSLDNTMCIEGCAVNQDGRSSSLTAPNGPSQQQVIRDALMVAKCSSLDLACLELHGTGTLLGDPIEVGAIEAVFMATNISPNVDHPLSLEAAKTAVGHTETAAGVIGLLHAGHGLTRCVSSALLHLRTVSLHVWGVMTKHTARAERGFHLGRETAAACNLRSVAGVSAFAFQGTNAHVVMAGKSCAKASHSSQAPPMRNTWYSSSWLARPPAAPFVAASSLENSLVLSAMLGVPSATLLDHCIMGRILLPAAAFVEVALGGAKGCIAGAGARESIIALTAVTI